MMHSNSSFLIECRDHNLISWRWAAIEAIRDRSFTSKSDVWSYAVTLWEIFTLGASPFASRLVHLDRGFMHLDGSLSVDNVQVVESLTSGQRLGKPNSCSEPIYQLMLSCWNFTPSRRPVYFMNVRAVAAETIYLALVQEFGEIAKILGNLLDDSEVSGSDGLVVDNLL